MNNAFLLFDIFDPINHLSVLTNYHLSWSQVFNLSTQPMISKNKNSILTDYEKNKIDQLIIVNKQFVYL